MSSTPNDTHGTSSHSHRAPTVALVHSPAYRAVLARCSPAVLLNRYALLDYLLHAFGAAESAPLWPQLRLVAPQPASRAQLEDFHAAEYVDALEAADALMDGNGNGATAACAVQSSTPSASPPRHAMCQCSTRRRRQRRLRRWK